MQVPTIRFFCCGLVGLVGCSTPKTNLQFSVQMNISHVDRWNTLGGIAQCPPTLPTDVGMLLTLAFLMNVNVR